MHAGSIYNRIDQGLQNDETIDHSINKEHSTRRYPIKLEYAIVTHQYIYNYSGHPANHETPLRITNNDNNIRITRIINEYFE